MDYKTIGHRIRKYRKSNNLSQEQLAERIGISPTHMSHIETGSTKLSLPVLVNIAVSLNTSTDSLLFEQKKFSPDDLIKVVTKCNEKQQAVIMSVITSVAEFF